MLTLTLEDITVLWLSAVSADALIFTLIYKIMTHKWWFIPEKEYYIHFDANSWSIGGTGSPLETLSQLITHILPDAEIVDKHGKQPDKTGQKVDGV